MIAQARVAPLPESSEDTLDVEDVLPVATGGYERRSTAVEAQADVEDLKDAEELDNGDVRVHVLPSGEHVNRSTWTPVQLYYTSARYTQKPRCGPVHAIISEPPEGDFSTRDVAWQRGKVFPYDGDASAPACIIPKERLSNFQAGIERDCGSRFASSSAKSCWKEKLFLARRQYHCEAGPENDAGFSLDENAEAYEVLKRARRKSRKMCGMSKKVGCGCHFTVQEFNASTWDFSQLRDGATAGEFVRIRFHNASHCSNGHRTVKSWPASEDTKAHIRYILHTQSHLTDQQVLDKIKYNTRVLIMRNQNISENEFFQRVRCGAIVLPRDYFIPTSVVYNIRNKFNQQTWKQADDEITSLCHGIDAAYHKGHVIKFRPMMFAPRVNGVRPKVMSANELECKYCEVIFEDAGKCEQHLKICPHRTTPIHNIEDDGAYIASINKARKDNAPVLVQNWKWCASFAAEVMISRLQGLKNLMSPVKKNVVIVDDDDDDDDVKDGDDDDTDDAFVENALAVALAPQHNMDQDAPMRFEEDMDLDRVLSEHEVAVVNDAFRVKLDDTLGELISAGFQSVGANTPVYQRDIMSLKPSTATAPGHWLTDQAIDWHMAQLNERLWNRCQRTNMTPGIYFCGVSFANQLFLKQWDVWRRKEGRGQPGAMFQAGKFYKFVRAQRRGYRPFNMVTDREYLFFPVNVKNAHWISVIMHTTTRVVYVLDPFCDEVKIENSAMVTELKHFAEDFVTWAVEAQRATEVEASVDDWNVVVKLFKANQPGHQSNGFDCGMFLISFARELYATGRMKVGIHSNYHFFQSYMHQRRLVAAFEMLTRGDLVSLAEENKNLEDMQHDFSITPERAIAPRPVRDESDDMYYKCMRSKLPVIDVGGKHMFVVRPFCLILMSPIQIRWMWEYGHRQGVQMDSTFATNTGNYSMFSLVVRHSTTGIGLPGAVFITSDERTETIADCMKTIREKLRIHNNLGQFVRGSVEWTPSAFIVDCAMAESNAIRMVFGDRVRIFWCMWHVIQAMKNWFMKNWRLTKDAAKAENDQRDRMKNKMITLVTGYVPSESPKEAWLSGYNEFVHEYQNSMNENETKCFNYFTRQWAPNYVRWAKALRVDCSYGGSDTTGTIESYHNVVKRYMKADNKLKINQRRIDWFLHFFVNTILPHFCEKEIAGERLMDKTTRKKNVDMLLKYHELMKERAFETMPRNSTDANFSAKVKYGEQVHTITCLYNLKEAAERTSHKCISCDCYDGQRETLCLPKIHAMMGTDEGECMKTLGLQPRDEQPLKYPERRRPEPKVINTDPADLCSVQSELVKNSARMQCEISRVVSSGSADMMECLNAKMRAFTGFIDALVKTHEQAHATHATDDVAHSSASSVRFSLGMHRVGAASGQTSSHHSTRRLKGLAESCAPKKKKRTHESWC